MTKPRLFAALATSTSASTAATDGAAAGSVCKVLGFAPLGCEGASSEVRGVRGARL